MATNACLITSVSWIIIMYTDTAQQVLWLSLQHIPQTFRHQFQIQNLQLEELWYIFEKCHDMTFRKNHRA